MTLTITPIAAEASRTTTHAGIQPSTGMPLCTCRYSAISRPNGAPSRPMRTMNFSSGSAMVVVRSFRMVGFSRR
ncbi:Uncharacterised protein [Mycobacteroides abscessus subsp. abscessus]|nr:Uncharacterised protein [Mycobacteroides abscessus subsp. abscessus]